MSSCCTCVVAGAILEGSRVLLMAQMKVPPCWHLRVNLGFSDANVTWSLMHMWLSGKLSKLRQLVNPESVRV